MLRTCIAVAATLMMAASPCAAQSWQPSELGAHRTGAVAGAYFRLPLDGRGGRRAAPQLGFRVAAVHDYRDGLAPAGPRYQADIIDFRLSGMARPTLLVAGQPVTGPDGRRLNALGTTETVGIIVGGVVLLVVVAVAAGGAGQGDTCPTIDGNRDHCINP